MTQISFALSVDAWIRSAPSFEANPQTDVQSLARHVQAGEALLQVLAPKPSRSQEHIRHAERIHNTCRTSRRRFMDLHIDWLYGVLTDGLTVRKTLRELVFDAADYCPGLVPTSARIDEERTRVQADKEGYEIDQGLLFHAILRSPTAGIHLVESCLRPTTRAQHLSAQLQRDTRLDLGTVLIERRGCAAHLTVNNNYCLNAEDDRLVEDMETAVDLALLDNEIRVGVLRGGVMTHPRYIGRRVFSAGINLKALRAGQISFVDFILRRELGFIHKIWRGLQLEKNASEICDWRASKRTLEKPWIAAVDSFAIGGGTQLLLVFDRIIAASDSHFNLPAAQEGIVPGFANLRLPRLVGSRKSREAILLGRKISAKDPDAGLLVDEVVDSTELDSAIERNIGHLSGPGVIANRHMINLTEEPVELFLRYASEFALLQAERLYSQDVFDKLSGA